MISAGLFCNVIYRILNWSMQNMDTYEACYLFILFIESVLLASRLNKFI